MNPRLTIITPKHACDIAPLPTEETNDLESALTAMLVGAYKGVGNGALRRKAKAMRAAADKLVESTLVEQMNHEG